MLGLEVLVRDFALGMVHADARQPQAVNARSKKPFRPGIGPHAEAQTVELVSVELAAANPEKYAGKVGLGIRYPELPRQKCDLCLGLPGAWEWAIEVKMLRILGDNGKANDNILMHIFSPYPEHRSAVTDCLKLVGTRLAASKAILIYGYHAAQWPLEPAIRAFEVLASTKVRLSERYQAQFSSLVHPVHSAGEVYAWQVQQATDG